MYQKHSILVSPNIHVPDTVVHGAISLERTQPRQKNRLPTPHDTPDLAALCLQLGELTRAS